MPNHLIAGSSLNDLLVDSTIDAVIAADMQLRVTAWNKAAAVLYDKERADVTGADLTACIPAWETDPEASHALSLAMQGFKSFLPSDKNIAWRSHSEMHLIPLRDEAGTAHGIMLVIHDVSHRIKAEQRLEDLNNKLQLKNTQLNRAITEMTSFALTSGENVRLPIRGLYTHIESLIKHEAAKLSDSGKASFRRIQQSLNKMNLLLDDMEQLAMISTVQTPDCLRLDTIVEGVREKMRSRLEETGAVIKLEKLCIVQGDKLLLEKLLVALIDNAIKFNDRAPNVRISCEKEQHTGGGGLRPGDYHKISVTDNGIGVLPADHETIFDLFKKGSHERKFRGQGLGLTLARKIMHAHDGYLELQPCEDGSILNCYFPVSKKCDDMMS